MASIKHYVVPGVYVSHRGSIDKMKLQTISLLETEGDETKYQFDRQQNGTVIYRLRNNKKTNAWAIENVRGNERLLNWLNSLAY